MREQGGRPVRYEFDGITFNASSGEMRVDERVQTLRPRTAAVLAALMDAADRTVSKGELLASAWPDAVVTEDSLTQCVKEIRRALGASEARVRTIPRRGYVFLSAAAALAPGRRQSRAGLLATATAMVVVAGMVAWMEWPSRRADSPATTKIVVLPFSGGDGEALPAGFLDGVRSDLTDDLARLPGTVIIGRSTAESLGHLGGDSRALGRELGVRFVVAGELHGDSDRVSIAVRLLDARDGTLAWTERFDGARAELAGLQRRIAARIARALEIGLVDAELAAIERERERVPRAHELTLRGWSSLNRGSRDEIAKARALFDAALALDPGGARAWLGIAHAHLTAHVLRWSPDGDADLRAAADALERASSLSPRQLHVRGTAGTLRAVRGRFEEARALLESEVADHPSNAHAYYWLGIVNILTADAQGAVAPLERAIELSPRDRSISGFHRALAVAHLQRRDPVLALACAQRSVGVANPHRLAYSTLAAAQQMSGQPALARASVAEFLRRNPGHSVARLRAEDYSARPEFLAQREPIYAAMIAAGLPAE